MRYKMENLKKVIKDLLEVIDKFPADRREDTLFDQWSLKDILAHMSGWNLQRIKELEDFIKGNKIEAINNFDEFNLKNINKRKPHTWGMIYDEFVKSCRDLTKVFQDVPEYLIDK